MTKKSKIVRPTYWDTSALVKLFFFEPESPRCASIFKKSGLRIISSLGYAELRAVMSRRRREMGVAKAADILSFLETPDWRFTTDHPSIRNFPPLDSNSSLRGADLWHFALFAKLKEEQIPELRMAVYDENLASHIVSQFGSKSIAK